MRKSIEALIINKYRLPHAYIYRILTIPGCNISTNSILFSEGISWKLNGIIFESIKEDKDSLEFDCTLTPIEHSRLPEIGDNLSLLVNT